MSDSERTRALLIDVVMRRPELAVKLPGLLPLVTTSSWVAADAKVHLRASAEVRAMLLKHDMAAAVAQLDAAEAEGQTPVLGMHRDPESSTLQFTILRLPPVELAWTALGEDELRGLAPLLAGVLGPVLRRADRSAALRIAIDDTGLRDPIAELPRDHARATLGALVPGLVATWDAFAARTDTIPCLVLVSDAGGVGVFAAVAIRRESVEPGVTSPGGTA